MNMMPLHILGEADARSEISNELEDGPKCFPRASGSFLDASLVGCSVLVLVRNTLATEPRREDSDTRDPRRTLRDDIGHRREH